MKGFNLIALTDKGALVIEKFNIQDKKAVINYDVENRTLRLIWRHRFRPFVRADSTELFIHTTMKDNNLVNELDYKLVIL